MYIYMYMYMCMYMYMYMYVFKVETIGDAYIAATNLIDNQVYAHTHHTIKHTQTHPRTSHVRAKRYIKDT